MLQVGSALNGYEIQASDGAIGSVSDFLFDDRIWKVRSLVVDVAASPDITRDQPVSRQNEINLYDFHGWDPVWGSSDFGPHATAPDVAVDLPQPEGPIKPVTCLSGRSSEISLSAWLLPYQKSRFLIMILTRFKATSVPGRTPPAAPFGIVSLITT